MVKYHSETRCRHIGYSFRLTARVLLYAPSHRQDNTYHGLCYTSRGALAGTSKQQYKTTNSSNDRPCSDRPLDTTPSTGSLYTCKTNILGPLRQLFKPLKRLICNNLSCHPSRNGHQQWDTVLFPVSYTVPRRTAEYGPGRGGWVCVWGGGGVGSNYLHAHIHLRFRHAHHETKDRLPSQGSLGPGK